MQPVISRFASPSHGLLMHRMLTSEDAMASAARPSAPSLPAVQQYFEVSLYLLVSTGILAIVSTGKLDPFSTFAPPAACRVQRLPVVARTRP